MQAFLRIRSLNIEPHLLVACHCTVNTLLLIIPLRIMHLSGGHSLFPNIKLEIKFLFRFQLQ